MASSVDTCKSEDNILVIFYKFLFDNNLQIKDVRYNDVCPKAENGDSIINKHLLYLWSTQGKWMKSDNTSGKYYIFISYLHG